ncbi:hypothetical protein [Proteiniclasticum sp.]|uniref:hypothetical protein n=1 Tax=Proteiniclasticum sp. TaxID=2053595 RepID=UPI0028A03700|nr:hypothetical protein [Proteiniclasticum sp.]
MRKNARIIKSGVLVLLAIGLFILGIIILPETIGLQVQLDGSMDNYVSKYLGLLIPLAITSGGAIVYYVKEEGKALLFSILGLGMYIATFFMNLLE